VLAIVTDAATSVPAVFGTEDGACEDVIVACNILAGDSCKENEGSWIRNILNIGRPAPFVFEITVYIVIRIAGSGF
jgi:hypothetical protein